MASDQVPGLWIGISLAVLPIILLGLQYYGGHLVKNVPPWIHAVIISILIAGFLYFICNIASIAFTNKWIHYGYLIGAAIVSAIVFAILIKTGLHKKLLNIEVEQQNKKSHQGILTTQPNDGEKKHSNRLSAITFEILDKLASQAEAIEKTITIRKLDTKELLSINQLYQQYGNNLVSKYNFYVVLIIRMDDLQLGIAELFDGSDWQVSIKRLDKIKRALANNAINELIDEYVLFVKARIYDNLFQRYQGWGTQVSNEVRNKFLSQIQVKLTRELNKQGDRQIDGITTDNTTKTNDKEKAQTIKIQLGNLLLNGEIILEKISTTDRKGTTKDDSNRLTSLVNDWIGETIELLNKEKEEYASYFLSNFGLEVPDTLQRVMCNRMTRLKAIFEKL
jgi:hypothetical protein